MDYPPTSQELRDRLAGQMLDEARRQADRVERKAGRSHEGAARQVVAGALREEGQGHRPLPRSVSPGKLEMIISEGRVYRSCPRLIVIDGGKR